MHIACTLKRIILTTIIQSAYIEPTATKDAKGRPLSSILPLAVNIQPQRKQTNDELNLAFATLPPVTFSFFLRLWWKAMILQSWLGKYPFRKLLCKQLYAVFSHFLSFSESSAYLHFQISHHSPLSLQLKPPPLSPFLSDHWLFIIYWMKTYHLKAILERHSAQATLHNCDQIQN